MSRLKMWSAVKDLISAGKVKHFGLSELKMLRPSAAPIQFSQSAPCKANIHSGGATLNRKSCRPVRNSASGWCPVQPLLGRGYLTGKIDETTTFADNDIRARNPRFTQDAIKANRAVVDLLERIGAAHNATPAQIALAWLLAQKPGIVPIPGSRKLERLDESNGAVNVELTANDLAAIDQSMSNITVLGNRY